MNTGTGGKGMDSLDEQVRQVKSAARQEQLAVHQNRVQADDKQEAAEEQVRSILFSASVHFVEVEPTLDVQHSEQSPGFTMMYSGLEDWRIPAFSVSSVCKPGHVDITVKDGYWEQVANVMGNWADWTDERTIYSGVVDETKVKEVLQTAFLQWYRRSLPS